MDYTKTNWVDELLAGDERYNILDNGGTPINSNVQIALATAVMQAGTAANAAAMNNIESGIETLYGALGSSPQGSYATVMARLAALDTLLGSNPQSIYADLAARLSGYDSGWINLPTCTYVSATSFTLDGNWTTKLKLGVYWSGYNESQKYEYVLSSSYNSGTGKTTVNLVPNTSFSLANAAITGSKFAYGQPPDFPAYLTYNLNPTGWSGSPSVTSYFCMNGKLVTCFCRVSGTSNLTTASGSAPISASDYAYGFFRATDNGSLKATPGMASIDAGSTITFSIDGSGTAWTNTGTKAIGRLCLQYMA